MEWSPGLRKQNAGVSMLMSHEPSRLYRTDPPTDSTRRSGLLSDSETCSFIYETALQQRFFPNLQQRFRAPVSVFFTSATFTGSAI